MYPISFTTSSPLGFPLTTFDGGAAEPIAATTLSFPRPGNPPVPECSSACQLLTLPNESGRSMFSKLCGAAVPDVSCNEFGQLETKVGIPGSGTQDNFIKCLCGANGDALEIHSSEMPAEATSTHMPAQTATPATPGASTDTTLNSSPKATNLEHLLAPGATPSIHPDRKIPLPPGVVAGISVASLVAFTILVGVCLFLWRKHLKRRENEPDFENVWDGQRLPRDIPTLGRRFKQMH